MQWEKYGSAAQAINRALTLNRSSARALYYAGLIDRRMGKPDEAIADLKEVVAQFPDSRDARRELGISLYQKHDYSAAMEQFTELQRIDPDDLAAHYNLAILDRRMGHKPESAEQQALFTTKKFDPGAPTYALNFIRSHPEISEESIPWHVHTNLPHSETIPASLANGRGVGGGQYGGSDGGQYGAAGGGQYGGSGGQYGDHTK
jgi:tetratricopeptide (TPR) repeat protein